MVLYALVFVTLVGLVVADYDPELHAKFISMPRSAFIEYFNSRNYSFKIAAYANDISKGNGDSNGNGNIFKKDSLPVHHFEESIDLPLKTHNLEGITLPENFDARTQWPQCESINEINDSGQCAGCLTFITAMLVTDRLCIHKNIKVNISRQDFECEVDNACYRGSGNTGYKYWKRQGVVSEECKPFDQEKLKKGRCIRECVNPAIDYNQDKHFAEEIYQLKDEDQIKAELVKNGPIQLNWSDFLSDFFYYKSGVYDPKFGNRIAPHCVRVIGYGVEDGIDYWLVANTFGTTWGEKGFAKIKNNRCQFFQTGLPKN